MECREGVHDLHMAVPMAMTQIFGVNGVSAEGFGRREDRRIPIRNSMPLRTLDGNPDDSLIDGLARECGPLLDPIHRLDGRQRAGGFTNDGYIELLEHLRRRAEILRFDQF